jgi:DNA (cytosine-5)-methyltransferase 1
MDVFKGKISLAAQNKILTNCIKKEIPLSEALSKLGLSYDSLRYCDYSDIVYKEKPNQKLEEEKKFESTIPAVSFFSGAGGLNIGFKYAGFDHLVSIEFNEIFCNTLRYNNPQKMVIGPPDYAGDLCNHEEISALLKNIIGFGTTFDGVFHGGPPCQPFSVASNQRFSKDSDKFKRKGFEDPGKGGLLLDYLWYIRQFLPKAFLIENVSGIEYFKVDNQIKSTLNELSGFGYNILPPKIINAAYYGVPQNRKRWLIIGTRSGKTVNFPVANDFPTTCSQTFSSDPVKVENHQLREHFASTVERYIQLPYGSRDKLGRVDRLNPHLPSKTVIAGGLNGGGRSHLHPYTPRTISVRECARLQTFPDSYVFTGPTARQFTQVGNAVPPLLAYKIARQIQKSLK